MRSCEGCPFYDRKVSDLALIESSRQKAVDLLTGTAYLVKKALEGTLTDEEVAAHAEDATRFTERARAETSSDGQDVTRALAALPGVANAHFEAMDEMNIMERRTQADIVRAQASCSGPLPRTDVAARADLSPMVCTADPDDLEPPIIT